VPRPPEIVARRLRRDRERTRHAAKEQNVAFGPAGLPEAQQASSGGSHADMIERGKEGRRDRGYMWSGYFYVLAGTP
jgi:hypothetical protein